LDFLVSSIATSDDRALVRQDQDLENGQCKAHKHKAEDLTSHKGHLKSFNLAITVVVLLASARCSCLVVADRSDLHADKPTEH
jgi:hypothetical protein